MVWKELLSIDVKFGKDADKNVPPVKLTIPDLILKVRYLVGDVVGRDLLCDSKYMLSTMDRVGKAMRKPYHWIDMNIVIYLVTDMQMDMG